MQNKNFDECKGLAVKFKTAMEAPNQNKSQQAKCLETQHV